MGLKGDSVDIPEYKKPNTSAFDLYGTTASKNDDVWSVTQSDLDQQTMNTVKQLRSDLLKSLGLDSTLENDEYTKTYMNEILKQSQPALENALIGRGLGGSTVYKDALTDLVTKAGTQAILSGQNYKLNNLNALQSYLTGEQSIGQNLLNLAANYDTQQQQLAQNLYNTQLPYQATYNQGMSTSDLINLGLGLMSVIPTGGSSLLATAPTLASLGGSRGSLMSLGSKGLTGTGGAF